MWNVDLLTNKAKFEFSMCKVFYTYPFKMDEKIVKYKSSALMSGPT